MHFIRHVPYEGLGHIRPWAEARGLEITETRPYEDAAFPAPTSMDLLVVLGGPMGVHDEDRHPWLVREKRFLAEVIEAGTPTLAICLGAQLVAHVLGADVRRHTHPEIGWHALEAVGDADSGVLAPFLAADAEVMQWHYDTLELPEGAVHLARSDACEAQAFAWGDHVLAVQFHPEMTSAEVAEVLERDQPLPEGDFVSDPDRLLEPARFARLSSRTHAFLDRLAAGWLDG